ncbi:hypothetical protein TeGR_g9067, partial [Tetraparma gracilis]
MCADDEYMRDEVCEKCNNAMSILLVGVSLLSFVVITYIVQGRAQQQSTMIGIKSITAFYQSAQLTTLVSIPWPKIALWAPFTIPPEGSAEQRDTYQQIVLLTLLVYSPLVQNAASMSRCITDPDEGWVLASDARVSCESSALRVATYIHAIAVIAVVGVGLPLFIVWKMMQLRREEKLDGDSIYAGLFE